MNIYAPATTPSAPRTKRLALFVVPLFGLALCGLALPVLAATDNGSTTAPNIQSPLIISEVQTGSCSNTNSSSSCTEDAKKEFIELYNPTNTILQANNWRVQYVSASGSTTTTLAILEGQVSEHGSVLLAHAGYYDSADLFFGAGSDSGKLAKSGGNIQITDGNNVVIDRIGWGSAVKNSSWPVIAEMKPGYSSARVLPGDISYTDPLQYANQSNAVTPQGGGYIPTPPAPASPPAIAPETPAPEPTPASNTDQSGPAAEVAPAATSSSNENSDTSLDSPNSSSIPVAPSTAEPPDVCLNIQLSEVLPNPTGTDTGQEFIELHNPTSQTLSLQGCSLKTSASTKTYVFSAGTTLRPDEYLAFSDTTTGLSLANAAGGTVTFSTSDNTFIQSTTYPQNMKDDQSWALIGTTWQSVALPSPNALNAADPQPTDIVEDNPNTATSSTPNTLVACKTGQERNPDTNRCRNIASDSAPTVVSCKAGQQRNPETNRCKAIANATTTQTPCKAGQTRNPETNRCKATTAASNTPKACEAGQVRNPATNRCKKATSLAAVAGVKDVKTAASAGGTARWLLIALAIAGALAYAAYEWRQEIYTKFRLNRITAKLPNLKPYRLKAAGSAPATDV